MNNKVKKLMIFTTIIIATYFSIKLFDDIIVVIKFIFNVLFPVIFGFWVAFLLNPLKQKMVKRKIPNSIATFMLIILFIGLILGSIFIVIPNLIEEMTNFIDKIPIYFDKLEIIYNKYLSKFNIKDTINNSFIEIMNNISLKTMSFLQTIISYSFDFFIGLFLSFYLLYDFDKITDYIKRRTDSLKYQNLRFFLKDLKESMYSYFKGIVQSNFVLFLLALIVFGIMRLNHFVVMALILSITNIIPYLGPYIGGAFAIIVGFNTSNKLAFFVFLVILALQFIDNYIISPKIQSRNNEIKPAVVIISIIIMGSIFGIFGMILAVPIVLFIRSINKNFVINK